MKNVVLIVNPGALQAGVAALALLAGSVRLVGADAIPYPNAGTPNPTTYTFTATGGDVIAYFAGSTAGGDNELGMLVNGVLTGAFGLDNHSSTVGQSLDWGYQAAGTPLVFVLQHNGLQPYCYSDPLLNGPYDSDGSDGHNHVYSTPYTATSPILDSIPIGTFLAFEDLPFLGSDFNYNDEDIVLTGVSVSPFSANTCTNACISLVCPNNIIVTSCVPTQVSYTPTATDSCSNCTVTVVCNPLSGSTFPLGTTLVTCTATDSCTNSCICSFTVTVQCTTNKCTVMACVSGASGPWNVSSNLNSDYPYGVPVGGIPNTNSPPTVVDRSSGLAFTAGDTLCIQSLTPGQPTLCLGAGGSIWSDAAGWINGGPVYPSPGPNSDPGQYTETITYGEELLGAFADGNGEIIPLPFAIGNGTEVTIPAGAAQLLLGVNDGWYNDNGGSVGVCITEGCANCTNVTLQLVSSNQIACPCPAAWQGVWQVTDCCGNTTTCTQVVTMLCMSTTCTCSNPPPTPCCPDTNGVKYLQGPDLTNGVDINATCSPLDPANAVAWVLADDFPCTNSGPITDIHLWGSWLNDQVDYNATFTLAIWSDYPTNSSHSFSYPRQRLWSQTYSNGQYVLCPYAGQFENFYNGNTTNLGSSSNLYYLCFDATLNATNIFTQTGTPAQPTNYWLSVTMQSSASNHLYFGWKSSATAYGDAAVFGTNAHAGLFYPSSWHPMTNLQSSPINLAFKITTATNCVGTLTLWCSNLTISCGSPVPTNPPAWTDPCCSNVSVTLTGSTTTNTGCGQTIYQTWEAFDQCCGTSNTCVRTVTVLPSVPTLLCSNLTISCGSPVPTNPPAWTDPCCSNVSVTLTGSTTTNTGCGQTIYQTWEAFDQCCGTSNFCTRTVTVVDTTPPTITFCPPPVRELMNSNCQLKIPPVSCSATDNCTPASQLLYTQLPPPNTYLPVGQYSTNVIVTVTDRCGNSNQCTVEVIGEWPNPVITGPTNVIVTNCLVPCVVPSVTDPCCSGQRLTITQSPLCGTTLCPGINSVIVTVTDCHNLSASKVIPLTITGPISFLANLTDTGVAINGSLLANGVVDPHYTLISVPAGMPSTWVSPTALAATDPWDLGDYVSKWISPVTNSNSYVDYAPSCPAGLYTYEYTFTLLGWADSARASISGRWAAGDATATMYLNDVQVSKITSPPGYNHWTSFTTPQNTLLSAPQPNTMTFVVTGRPIYLNKCYVGLRVEFTSAVANCCTCAPPVIVSMSPNQCLPWCPLPWWSPAKATFTVTAQPSSGLTYEWYRNNSLVASGTSSTLTIPATPANAGAYFVRVCDNCGCTDSPTRWLTLYYGCLLPPWAWWNVAQLDNPLAATIGPDLKLVGASYYGTNFDISVGTTEDFGLPDPGGQVVNVMDIAPLPADTSIQVPLIAPAGSNSVNSYTLIMDLYEPDTSLGTSSTLFQSLACCMGMGTNGQDGVALTLDAANNLHLNGSAVGVPFDVASAAPLPVDAWNRVALVVDDPQDGVAVNLSLYLNGQPVASLAVPTSVGLPINWSNSSPTLLSVQTNAAALNGEFYVSSIQFHAVALASQIIAGMDSPNNGPIPSSQTVVVGPSPVLSATVSNGVVSLNWTTDSPYILQETTDLSSGVWSYSPVPFTQSLVGDQIVTTAVANPATEGPTKFFRLIFSP